MKNSMKHLLLALVSLLLIALGIFLFNEGCPQALILCIAPLFICIVFTAEKPQN